MDRDVGPACRQSGPPHAAASEIWGEDVIIERASQDAGNGFQLASQTFNDFDAFAQAIGAGGEVLPMAAGPYHASLRMLRLSGVEILRASVPAQLRRAGRSANSGLIIPIRAPQAVTFAGHVLEPDQVVAVSDGADIDAFWTQHVEWVSVALERFAHAMLAGDWRPEVARPGGHSFPRLAAGDLYRLGTTLLSAQGAAGAPGRLSTACLVAGVRDSIETAISRALAGIEAWSWQPRSTRSQVRIVRRADEYLREHRARPIYTNELCDVVGVSPRTLHSAFAALYGCSPHAYLKRRRLLMVHRVLQASEGALLVKTAALDHGFWHLGNFARDYRALFGVVPTVTRGAFAVTRG